MKIGVNTFAYTHSDELIRMVESLDPGEHEMAVYLHLHSEKPSVVEACQYLAQRPDVKLFAWGKNRGLAKSMNDSMIEAFGSGCEVIVNANDDTVWQAGDLARLAEYAIAHPEFYCVQAVGTHSAYGKIEHSYSAGAFQRYVMDGIGMFDENFWPAYYEDNDFAYRASLLGWKMGTCHETNVFHFGSATLAHDSELRAIHDRLFDINGFYYSVKWGGRPGQERHQTPFNVAWKTPYIAPSERHAPYGEFDRTDLTIVEI